MKIKLVVIFFILGALSGGAHGSNFLSVNDIFMGRGTFRPPPGIPDLDELNKAGLNELQLQNSDLKKVKYYLINGETRLAQVYLSRLSYSNSKLRPVIFRYMGLTNFIEGKFQKSLENLSLDELNDISHYDKICVLKVLNLIALSKVQKLETEWNRCRTENVSHIDGNNFLWLDTLVKIKLGSKINQYRLPYRGIKLGSLDNIQIKLLIKMALYLNQEKAVLEQITDLDLTQIQDPDVRELLGHLLFRATSYVQSYKFLEDLDSPNAENIKGNFYLLRKKYELAYAQFKVALNKKANSQNAMERLLPLAWILGDWEGGTDVAMKVISSPQTLINKMTLLSAFLAQKGEYSKAEENLKRISDSSKKGTEIEVNQLKTFVYLMQNKGYETKKFANISCGQFDLLNCWLRIQMDQWDAFPLTMRRNEKIPHGNNWEKLISKKIDDPLKEVKFVNQSDIEELDEKLIPIQGNTN